MVALGPKPPVLMTACSRSRQSICPETHQPIWIAGEIGV
jgi:hypothetical protein